MIFSTNTQSSIELLKKFPNHPMIGIFNINTKEIFLAPCIIEKVSINGHTLGEFNSGNFIDENLESIGAITAETLVKYQASGFLPRIFNDNFEYYSSHVYLVQLVEPKMNPFNIKTFTINYRGFTITHSDNAVEYSWVSGSLNSPHSKIRDKCMEAKDQEEVKKIFQQHLNLDATPEPETKECESQVKKTSLAPLKLFDKKTNSMQPGNTEEYKSPALHH